jgi:hypothetical protein
MQCTLAQMFNVSGCSISNISKGVTYHTGRAKDNCTHSHKREIYECVQFHLDGYRKAHPEIWQHAREIIKQWRAAQEE